MKMILTLSALLISAQAFGFGKEKPTEEYYHTASFAEIRTVKNGGEKSAFGFHYSFPVFGYNYRPRIYDLMEISDSCKVGANKIIKHVGVHEWAASYNHDSLSARVSKEILDYLKSLRATSDPCSEQLHALYLIAAISNLYASDQQEIPLLAVFLYHADRIKLIAPEDRTDLGVIWNQKNSAGKFQILGTYSCRSATISIDITLTPYDLAAHFIHEVSHLLRDKLVEHRPEGLTLSDWVLFDETTSIAFSSFSQRRVAVGSLHNRFIGGTTRTHKIDHDLTLFRRGGRMDKLWEITFAGAFGNARDFFSRTFYTPSNYEVRGEDIHKEITEEVNAIYQLVSHQYFGEKISRSDLGKFHRDAIHGDFDPLSDYANEFPSHREDRRLTPEMDWFKRLDATLAKPSALCEEFALGIKRGELGRYVGTKGGDDDPVHGGNEGVRPTEGDETLRFCLRPESSF